MDPETPAVHKSPLFEELRVQDANHVQYGSIGGETRREGEGASAEN